MDEKNQKNDIMTLEAVGEFPFEFFVEKAVAAGTDEEMILEGVASTTNVDHDHERMTKGAITSMANIINKEGVPLRIEHQKEEEAVIGKVFKAWVDERNQLHIQASLDKSHIAAPILYRSMKTGAKMGFSVGGLVKHAVREFSEKLGKVVNTFYDVALKEVSVTPRPANYDSWAVAKSIAADEEEAGRYRHTSFYDEFLFENPRMDYLQTFAKSVPDEAWRKTASQSKSNNMDKETQKKNATEETTEKAVSRSEFNSLVKMVSDGFNSVLKTFEARKDMHVDAHDQNSPDEKKPDPMKVTAKAEGEAMDQNNPDMKKPDPEMVRAKAEAGRTGQEGAGKDDGSDLHGEREKSESETETEKGMKGFSETIKAMDALTARLKKTETEETKEKMSETEMETKTKAESETEEFRDKSESETETTKGQHPIDSLVTSMAKAMFAMGERLEKDGRRVPGFEKSWVDSLQRDPEFQKSIAEMLKVPGVKKSVSMGVPYVPTKDGGRLALTLQPAGAPTVTKSAEAKGKNFLDVYKSDFSSFSDAAANTA